MIELLRPEKLKRGDLELTDDNTFKEPVTVGLTTLFITEPTKHPLLLLDEDEETAGWHLFELVVDIDTDGTMGRSFDDKETVVVDVDGFEVVVATWDLELVSLKVVLLTVVDGGLLV